MHQEEQISAIFHKPVHKVAPEILYSIYSQNLLLMRIVCRILDLRQAVLKLPTPTVEIVFNPLERPMGQLNTRGRKCTKPPHSPSPPPVTELYRQLPTSEPTLPGRAGSNETVRRVQRTKPNTARRRGDRNQDAPPSNPMRNPRTRRNINRG